MNPKLNRSALSRYALLVAVAAFTACSSSGPVRKSSEPYPQQPSRQPAPGVQQIPAAPTPIQAAPGIVFQGTPEQLLKTVQTYYQNGKVEDATNLLWSVKEEAIPPANRTEFWNLRGLIELQKRQPEAAQISFQKALSQNRTPEYRGYYQYNYASALYESNRSNDALDVLNSIDVGPLDVAQQGKVFNLKQKIHAKIPPANALQPRPSPGVGGEIVAPAVPTEIYHGPTKPFRIGLLVPLSGKYETFGKKVQKAVELAFQHSSNNQAKNFELVPMDSGETPVMQIDALRKLVEEQQVIAVIGPVLSKGIEELSARADYYRIPLISIAQSQGSLGTNLFSCSISNKNQVKRIADYAMKVKGYTKFAILAPSNTPGEELANLFWDEIEAHKGSIKAMEYYDPEATDFREAVDKAVGLHYLETRAEELKVLSEKRKELKITRKTMKTAQYFNLPPIVDFEAVFIADDGRIAGQVIPTFTFRDAKGMNFLGLTSWNSSQFLSRTTDQAEGALFPVAFNSLKPAKTTKAFYDLFLSTYNAYPGEFDAVAFDAASLVLEVMDHTPSSREDFKSELESVHRFDSATGEITMDGHQCTRDLSLYSVKKNKFEVVEE
ncbi:MAG: penicillin-binding protein activator [Bdellovibrionales bacterium]|nr:penicillin-binding protein activator [Bdellovibrionales bacterium]